MKMSMERWWKDTDKRKPKYGEKNISNGLTEIEPGLPR